MMLSTYADYQAALARLGDLMDAPEGSAEEAELEALSGALQAYEDEHYPIGEPTPEAAAEFRREQERDGELGSDWRVRWWAVHGGAERAGEVVNDVP